MNSKEKRWDFQRPAIDTIISRGVTAAMDKQDKLVKLKNSLGDVELLSPTTVRNPFINIDTLIINNIKVEGITPRESSYLERWININDTLFTRAELEKIISRIYGSGMFNWVHYRLEGQNPFDMTVTVDVKEANRLNIGVHFDSKDMAAILANTTLRLNNYSVPRIYRNMVGGRIDNHYMPQQISLQGSTGMEFLDNMVFTTDVTLHYRLTYNNYIYTNLNFLAHSNHLHTLLEGESFLGINLGYSYMTVAGPLRLELGYSELSKRIHPYFSLGYYF